MASKKTTTVTKTDLNNLMSSLDIKKTERSVHMTITQKNQLAEALKNITK